MNVIFTTVVLLISLALLVLAYKSRRHKRLRFPEFLVSTPAIVDTPLTPQGSVLVNGELWLARSVDDKQLDKSTKVIVVGVENHLLIVAER
jgi:membrane-bound ClpP family serine protease